VVGFRDGVLFDRLADELVDLVSVCAEDIVLATREVRVHLAR
jgi:hypothetical protein